MATPTLSISSPPPRLPSASLLSGDCSEAWASDCTVSDPPSNPVNDRAVSDVSHRRGAHLAKFQAWAARQYGENSKTKTVTRHKYARIVAVLTGAEPPGADNAKFRFWVKAKGFKLGLPRDWGHHHGVSSSRGHSEGQQVLYVPTKVQSSAGTDKEYKRVAVIDDFFNIIYSVHVEAENKGGKHAGQKRTYRAIAETYAFLPREAVTRFLMSCTDCQKRMYLSLEADGRVVNNSPAEPGSQLKNRSSAVPSRTVKRATPCLLQPQEAVALKRPALESAALSIQPHTVHSTASFTREAFQSPFCVKQAAAESAGGFCLQQDINFNVPFTTLYINRLKKLQASHRLQDRSREANLKSEPSDYSDPNIIAEDRRFHGTRPESPAQLIEDCLTFPFTNDTSLSWPMESLNRCESEIPQSPEPIANSSQSNFSIYSLMCDRKERKSSTTNGGDAGTRKNAKTRLCESRRERNSGCRESDALSIGADPADPSTKSSALSAALWFRQLLARPPPALGWSPSCLLNPSTASPLLREMFQPSVTASPGLTDLYKASASVPNLTESCKASVPILPSLQEHFKQSTNNLSLTDVLKPPVAAISNFSDICRSPVTSPNLQDVFKAAATAPSLHEVIHGYRESAAFLYRSAEELERVLQAYN